MKSSKAIRAVKVKKLRMDNRTRHQRLTAKEEAASLPPLRERAVLALQQQQPFEPLQRMFVRDARGKIIHLRIAKLLE